MSTDAKYNATHINPAGTEKSAHIQTMKAESVVSKKKISQSSEGGAILFKYDGSPIIGKGIIKGSCQW
jgi:hypothetical protein